MQRNDSSNRGRGRTNKNHRGGRNVQQPGILGPCPTQSNAASTIHADLDQAMHTMSLTPPDDQWYMDTGATLHMTISQGTLSSFFNMSIPKHILAGNCKTIPIRGYGHTYLPPSYPPLHLKTVLYAPHLIKNLISVRHLSTDII
ncbi:hypothetical protein Tco_0535484 [Tanacetum coccineum]